MEKTIITQSDISFLIVFQYKKSKVIGKVERRFQQYAKKFQPKITIEANGCVLCYLWFIWFPRSLQRAANAHENNLSSTNYLQNISSYNKTPITWIMTCFYAFIYDFPLQFSKLGGSGSKYEKFYYVTSHYTSK